MPASIFNERNELTKEKWVVSVLNTGSPLAGHAVILLEGLNPDGSLFVGHYDIRAKLWEGEQNNINSKGYISEIKCIESAAYARNYKGYTHQSYNALNINKNGETQSEVEKLISGIKSDKKRVDAYTEYLDKKNQGIIAEVVYPVPYQLLGKQGFGVNPDNGCNCANWCTEKLKLAGIDAEDGKKPESVANRYLSCISKYRGTLLFATSVLVAGVGTAYLAMSESELTNDMRDKLPTPFNN